MWKLEPSFERLRNAYCGSFRRDADEYIRQGFKQRAHHYLQYLPDERDELEWMALMRHYGAPTRLLDWTRSPYVAAFFALADAKEQQTSAIWAIDAKALRAEAIWILSQYGIVDSPTVSFSFSDPDVFARIFTHDTSPAIVAPVQPHRMNERATSQQGLFLCSKATVSRL